MASEPKPCPVCGREVTAHVGEQAWCDDDDCPMSFYGEAAIPISIWNRLTITPERERAVVEAAVVWFDDWGPDEEAVMTPVVRKLYAAVRAYKEGKHVQ